MTVWAHQGTLGSGGLQCGAGAAAATALRGATTGAVGLCVLEIGGCCCCPGGLVALLLLLLLLPPPAADLPVGRAGGSTGDGAFLRFSSLRGMIKRDLSICVERKHQRVVVVLLVVVG